MRGEFFERAAADFLEGLGELPAHGGWARAETVREVRETVGKARTRFVKHECRRYLHEFGDAVPPLPRFWRQKSLEIKSVGRQPSRYQRREQRRGAGNRINAVARLDRGGNEFVTRIRDKGCTGIGNERDGCPLGEALTRTSPATTTAIGPETSTRMASR